MERSRSHRDNGYIVKKCGVWREIWVIYRSMRKRKVGSLGRERGLSVERDRRRDNRLYGVGGVKKDGGYG